MSDVACRGCGAGLGPPEKRAAGITLFRLGDERIDSWFWCGECRNWTREECYDRFMGDSTISARGPYEVEAPPGS